MEGATMTEPAKPPEFSVHRSPVSIDEVEADLHLRREKRLRRDRISGLLYPVATLAAFLILWEAATRLLSVPVFLLPPPSIIAAAMHTHAAVLAKESMETTLEIVLGFGLSIAVGVPLALAIFLWPPFARTVYPLLVSSQAVPKVAVAPLFLVWFGFGLLPKVLIAFLVAFFPVVINTAMGLASIEREKIYLAQSMGLGRLATFFKIQLPNALPSIFAGLKISITLAVVGAVVGEFVAGQAGLGYLLLLANGNMDTALLFAGIVALTVLGVVFFALIGLVERLVLPPHTIEGAAVARELM
jgi:NitT/TauT family transport system permease protein